MMMLSTTLSLAAEGIGQTVIRPVVGVLWLFTSLFVARNIYDAVRRGHTRSDRRKVDRAENPTFFFSVVVGRSLLALGMLALSLWCLGAFK
jgi:hypothetical protein